MQTRLTPEHRLTPAGRRAEEILRNCVHCGFCNATCPTYRQLGDELDGPRGRIYLIKQVLEGHEPGRATQIHLDRCLLCRACETTCPSGVDYAELLEFGRAEVERRVGRTAVARVARWALRRLLPHPAGLRALLFLPGLVRRWLPRHLRPLLPGRTSLASTIDEWPAPRHERRMLVIDGCVQAALRPDINLIAARILDRLGISLLRVPGCCGAIPRHLGAADEAEARMRENLEAWRGLEDGIEAVLTTSSACSLMLREHARPSSGDGPPFPIRDIAEVLAAEDLSRWRPAGGAGKRICFHPPCTLQHGLRLDRTVETVLGGLGYVLLPFADRAICCGSAGTYSLFEAAISRRLRDDKLAALAAPGPDCIATANIGCLLHLETGADQPVVHWLELVEQAIAEGAPGRPAGLGSNGE